MDLDINNFKPDMEKTATSVSYFFKDYRLKTRQNNIMAGYKGRSGTIGRSRKILNIEELATLWHFPIEAVVRAPLIQKSAGRKSEPPTSLPLDGSSEPSSVDFSSSGIFEDEVLDIQNKNKNNKEKDLSQQDREKNKNNQQKALPDFFFDEDEGESKEKINNNEDNEVPENLPFV